MKVDRFFVDVSNKQLLISFTLDESDHNDTYGLSDIYIDFTDTFICANDPSEQAIKITADELKVWDDDPKHKSEESTDTHIKIENFPVSFDRVLSNNPENELYFLYVYETISNNGDTPTINETFAFKQSFSVVTLYNLLLSFLRNIKGSNCNKCVTNCNNVIPMLLYEGFLRAMDLQKYKKAVEFWKLLHEDYSSTSKNCSCNG